MIAAGNRSQFGFRQSLILASLHYPVLEHLGYGPIEGLRQRLDEGMDAAVDYFFGDWWRADPEDAKVFGKPGLDHDWLRFDALPTAMLIGGLTGRWNDVENICTQFVADVSWRRLANQIDGQWPQLFQCMVSNLLPEPIPRIQSVLARVKSDGNKRTRLLCAAWEAAVAGDQKTFDKSLKESVRHFLKMDARDVPNTTYWVAQHQSLVWLIAERNGLQFPTLPAELDAAVIRRQTTGLA